MVFRSDVETKIIKLINFRIVHGDDNQSF